jgi:hypothetical protein
MYVSQFLHILNRGILIRRGSPGLEERVALIELVFVFLIGHRKENINILLL